MARIRRPALTLATLALAGLVLAGCTVSGGGQMASTTGAKQATFGFTITSEGDSDVMRGNWHDGWVKLRFTSGTFDNPATGDCADISGTYESTSKSSPGSGNLDLTVCDEGEPGVSSGDSIDFDPTSGPYSSYSNSGSLTGGNVNLNSKNDGP